MSTFRLYDFVAVRSWHFHRFYYSAIARVVDIGTQENLALTQSVSAISQNRRNMGTTSFKIPMCSRPATGGHGVRRGMWLASPTGGHETGRPGSSLADPVGLWIHRCGRNVTSGLAAVTGGCPCWTWTSVATHRRGIAG